ncbi:DNA-methyltransferase [Salinispira pacifica]
MPDTHFETVHRLLPADAQDLSRLSDESIDLVVTSPPYPMIAMWDQTFGEQDPQIAAALEQGRATDAFERMHSLLDRAWSHCRRLLRPGSILCVNIGDATRSIGGEFRLFTNQTRITAACESLGFTSLPPIIWRKPTNAPNKFMGSGMYPGGAYVTLEHEYILVFRKGGRRQFGAADRARRRRSAYFWEERNSWFSDLWLLPGTRQERAATGGGPPTSRAPVPPEIRRRSAAFPLEIALRLVLMYSVEGDTLLDPFVGTGTTLLAAMATGRSSVGVDRDSGLLATARQTLLEALPVCRRVTETRISAHRAFEESAERAGRPLAYRNRRHDFAVKTRQEVEMELRTAAAIRQEGDRIVASY